MPSGKRMAQVMPAEVFDSRTLQRRPPRLRVDLDDGLTLVSENMRAVVAFAPLKHRHSHRIQWHRMRVTILMLIRSDPQVLPLKAYLFPLQPRHVALPQPGRDRELRHIA